jgi:hypothetical protein
MGLDKGDDAAEVRAVRPRAPLPWGQPLRLHEPLAVGFDLVHTGRAPGGYRRRCTLAPRHPGHFAQPLGLRWEA